MKNVSAHPRAQMYLQSPTATVCTDADTYYAVSGTFVDGVAHFFSLSSPVLTYTGDESHLAMFNGVAYLKASNVCACTVAMFVNGSPSFSGTVNFEHANAAMPMSFPLLLTLNQGDTFQVYIKSSVASATFTVSQLVCIFT